MTTEHQPGSPGAVEEVPKDHFDTDGNPCTLDTLCRREPAWAANIIRTLRARVAELEAEARMWSATAEENEAAIRHLVSIIDRDGGQLQQGDPPVSAAARAGCSVHVLHDRAESAEARVAALEKLFDDAGQGNYNVLALIDHYQSEAMTESERRRVAEARVKELEIELLGFEVSARKRNARITELESQLAAAREGKARLDAERTRLVFEGFTYADVFRLRDEQGLEALVRSTLKERNDSLLVRFETPWWKAEWRSESRSVYGHARRNAQGATLPALLRAILEVEAKGG